MPKLLNPPDITTGDQFVFAFTFTVDDVAIGTSTDVQVAIVDKTKESVLIAAKTATWNGTISQWAVTFTNTETKQLLSEANDPGSALKHSLVLIEVQAGTPYFITRHLEAVVGKGLIA